MQKYWNKPHGYFGLKSEVLLGTHDFLNINTGRYRYKYRCVCVCGFILVLYVERAPIIMSAFSFQILVSLIKEISVTGE